MNVYYSPAYVGASYAFETTRKAGWVAASLDAGPIEGLVLKKPLPLTFEQVARVHDEAYVRAVQSGAPAVLAQSQGFTWDAGLWPMLLASNGGAVAAALDALQHGVSGSLSSGLHHASRSTGLGYCTFNGLVMAALAAFDAGAKSVLILDLDAHCGGGTASLIQDEPRIWQFDVSVDPYDRYQSTERCELRLVTQAEQYLAEVDQGLSALEQRAPGFDLCLYNAGMDPFEGCADGALQGITRELLAARERRVFEWCCQQHIPVAFMLAGGYIGEGLDQAGLTGLHRLTLEVAAASNGIQTR